MPFYKTSELTRIVPSTGSLIEVLEAGNTRATTIKDIFGLAQTQNLSKDISGSFTTSGNQTITGNLTVQGSTFLGDGISDINYIIGNNIISGNLFHSGNLTSTGNATFRGSNFIGGPNQITNFSGLVNVSGNTNFFGFLNVLTNASITGNLNVSGNTILGDGPADTTRIQGGVLITGFGNIIGPLGISDSIYVSGGSGVFSNILYVKGSSIQTGNCFFGNPNATSYFYGATNFNNIFDSGNLVVVNTADVSGLFRTYNKNYLGTGANDHTYIRGSLYAQTGLFSDGNSFFKQNVTITGGLNVTGNATFTGAVSAAGKISAGNGFKVAGNSYLVGDAYINSNVSVTGNVSVSGNLDIVGSINSEKIKWVKFDGFQRPVGQGTIGFVTNTATFSGLPTSHNIKVNDIVQVSNANGASSSLYNGQFAVTAISSTTISYLMGGTPTAISTAGKIDTVIKARKNVSGVIRNTDGDYSIYFTSPFSSDDYFCSLTVKNQSASSSPSLVDAALIGSVHKLDPETTSYKRIQVRTYNDSNRDSSGVYFLAQI